MTVPSAVVGVTSVGSLGLCMPILRRMRDIGWQVHLVCAPSAHRDSLADFDVTEIDMTRGITPGQDAQALSQWVRLLRDLRPEVLIGATPKAALLSLVAARTARVPVRILWAWGARWDGMSGVRGRMLSRLDWVAAHSATEVVAVSPSLANLYVEAGVAKTRPVVIGAGGTKGVNTEMFRFGHGSAGGHTLGFVGRLSRDKGISDLVDVFETCRTLIPDTRLVVAGSVDAAQPIHEETQRRLLQPGVEWLGTRADIPDLLTGFDLLVFPSIREGLPNAVIEAASCGVPTVGYHTTGMQDAVRDGVTGRLVTLGDVDGLARAAIDLLSSGQAAGMRPAARQFAVDSFSEDLVVTGFVEHLAQVAGR